MREVKYNPIQIANSISKSYKFEEHCIKRSREKAAWKALNVNNNRQSYKNLIAHAIRSKDSHVLQCVNNRDIYWNPKTNVIVAIDLDSKSKGTAYIPRSKDGKTL